MSARHAADGRFGKAGKALKRLAAYPALTLFFVLLFGMFAIDLATPDKQRSELENTTLEQRPGLSLAGKDLAGITDSLNTYFTKYSKYVKEQVAGRDGWIGLQAGFETLVFQKTESGGILLGQDGQMFARTYGLLSSEEKRLPLNTQAVGALARRWPGRVTVMLAPSAATVYPEEVPAGAPLLDENAYLDQTFAELEAAGAAVLDVRDTLAAHKEEYLYYRTDHHWTTLGAYYAYTDYCAAQGLTPFDRSAGLALEVPHFLGTSYAKARTPLPQPDTITYYDLPNQMQVYTVQADGSLLASPSGPTGLYNPEQWGQYDKYAAFLYGNNGFTRIQGDGTGSVLVVKDSYANSFIPYLTANYAVIDVVDFRAYPGSLDPRIRESDYDQILVLYSFASFKADQYLSRAGIES